MTHGSHALVAGRPPGLLTGALACYRIYETGDARRLTVQVFANTFCVAFGCSQRFATIASRDQPFSLAMRWEVNAKIFW